MFIINNDGKLLNNRTKSPRTDLNSKKEHRPEGAKHPYQRDFDKNVLQKRKKGKQELYYSGFGKEADNYIALKEEQKKHPVQRHRQLSLRITTLPFLLL